MSLIKSLFVVSTLALSMPAVGGLVPVDLRCESQTNPVAIDEASPRLSWRVQETVAGERGQRQTAYRILVASTPENLAADQGDLWDTGQVNSNRTTMIPYAGAALSSHRVCYWKVRVWDRTGQPSAWSTTSSWSMGLLNPSDWTAQWIGRDDAPVCAETNTTFTQASWIWYPEGNPASSAPLAKRWFRREFTVPSGVTVTQALVSMTADDRFSLYVNGQVALAGTDWKQAFQQNIASLLTSGTNVLAIEAENASTNTPSAGLIGSVTVRFSNGGSITILTDGSWITANQLVAGWNQKTFSPAGWSGAMVLGGYGMNPWGKVGALFHYWSGQLATSSKPYLASTYLRKDFTLSQTPSRAVLYVTALGLVEPRLNGQPVGSDCFTPGWTEYSKRLYYRAYDVSTMVHSGANTLGAILGDGWFRGNVGMDGQNIYGTRTRLRAQLRLTYADGSTQEIVSKKNWGHVSSIVNLTSHRVAVERSPRIFFIRNSKRCIDLPTTL